MDTITLETLTTETLDGTGIFDGLMRTVKLHIHEEYTKGRIKGPEYSALYLGALQAVLAQALEFALAKEKANQEVLLLKQQVTNAGKEGTLLDKQAERIDSEINLLIEQIASEVKRNEDDGLLDKEKERLVAQTEQIEQQTSNLLAEGANIPKQGLLLDAQLSQANQQTENLEAEGENIPKQGKVLDGQKCLLDAQYDLTVEQRNKAVAETAVLNQKEITERAQTSGAGVDPDSVVGRQKALYEAQKDGFERDAEQKAARILVDTWSVRRSTDEGTVADATNMLEDATIGRAISKLLQGINA